MQNVVSFRPCRQRLYQSPHRLINSPGLAQSLTQSLAQNQSPAKGHATSMFGAVFYIPIGCTQLGMATFATIQPPGCNSQQVATSTRAARLQQPPVLYRTRLQQPKTRLQQPFDRPAGTALVLVSLLMFASARHIRLSRAGWVASSSAVQPKGAPPAATANRTRLQRPNTRLQQPLERPDETALVVAFILFVMFEPYFLKS